MNFLKLNIDKQIPCGREGIWSLLCIVLHFLLNCYMQIPLIKKRILPKVNKKVLMKVMYPTSIQTLKTQM